jgi:YidC/Oxa1 family membrane protein insertase
MDRNAVLAVILISLIMTVWLVWFSPQPPQEPIETQPTTQTDSAPTPREPVVEEQARPALEEIPPTTATDSSFAASFDGQEEFVSVENERFTAVFSTKGATLVSFELKNYKQFDQETPIQMVEQVDAGALSLEFTSPASHLISTSDLFFTVDGGSDAVRVIDTEQAISFSSVLGDGVLTVRYTFRPDSYEIVMDVERREPTAFMTRAGYELVWNGGIPFAEGLGNQEAQVAAAIARSGGEVEQINLTSEPTERSSLNGVIEWVAVRNGFFTTVMIPDGETRGAELEGVRTDDVDGTVLANHFNARIMIPETGESYDRFRLFIGPIDFYQFREYGLDLYDIVDYGFGQTITRPIAKWLIIPVFRFLSNFLDNFGLIIIVFAFLIKLILYPLTKSSFKSMAMMRQLQPQMNEIKEKYGDDPQKQQQAMMKLYKESGVNPIGGCLPQLLQLPILYALFRFFPSAIEIRQEGFLWSTDLSAPDVLLALPFSIPIYGAHIAGFPLLMSAAMIVQMRLQGTHQQQAGQMKVMMMIMPIFILVIFNNFAAGLSLYYLTYNILSAIQQKFINRSLEKEEEGEQATSKPSGGKKTKPARPGQKKSRKPAAKKSRSRA